MSETHVTKVKVKIRDWVVLTDNGFLCVAGAVLHPSKKEALNAAIQVANDTRKKPLVMKMDEGRYQYFPKHGHTIAATPYYLERITHYNIDEMQEMLNTTILQVRA